MILPSVAVVFPVSSVSIITAPSIITLSLNVTSPELDESAAV